MKLIALILLSLGFTLTANAKPLTVKSKHYTCAELQDLVQEEGTVHIKWWGSLDVHSDESVCYDIYGPWGEVFQTSWKTKDKFFCVAGYSCRRKLDDDYNN